MQVITRIEGASARILRKLVKRKYYSTKSEAVRAGVLELGLKWSISPEEEEEELVARKMRKMRSEIKSGKKKIISLRDVAKEAGVSL